MQALCRTDYTSEQWGAHVAYNAARGWAAPEAAESALGELRSSGFVDSYAALEQPQTPEWPAARSYGWAPLARPQPPQPPRQLWPW